MQLADVVWESKRADPLTIRIKGELRFRQIIVIQCLMKSYTIFQYIICINPPDKTAAGICTALSFHFYGNYRNNRVWQLCCTGPPLHSLDVVAGRPLRGSEIFLYRSRPAYVRHSWHIVQIL